MAIETTEFAEVSISVTPVGVPSGNFGVLGFLAVDAVGQAKAGKGITSAERTRSYTSLVSVSLDWEATSEVYLAASAFYGQTPTPRDFTVLMNYVADAPAVLVGGALHSDLATINALGVAAEITMAVDGTAITTTVDVSAAADFSAVAALVETALALVEASTTCTYTNDKFEVTSPTSGVLSTITFATQGLAIALGLDQTVAQVSQGFDIETPVVSLAEALASGLEFTALDIDKTLRDKVVAPANGNTTLEISNWATANKKIFMNTSNNLDVLSAAIDTDTASVLKLSASRFTHSCFSRHVNAYPGSAIFGRAASVNFSSTNSTITLNLKQLANVPAENLTPAEFAAMQGKYCSAVVVIGNSVSAFVDSRMASGSWLDTTHGLMWLENRNEVDMFNLLYQQNTKIPYTQTGINMAEGQLTRSLQSAVRNGLCAPGFLPDGTFLPEGFVVTSIPIGEVASSDRGNRVYNGLSYKMVGAGALHGVAVSGYFSE
jgi:hypothetical protein